VPLHLRFALALVAFAAAGSALATFAAPTGNGGSRGGYAVAISAGSGLKLIRAANGATRSGADPEVLACRGVLHVGGGHRRPVRPSGRRPCDPRLRRLSRSLQARLSTLACNCLWLSRTVPIEARQCRGGR
jgi:hypothetical protein